MKEAILVFMGGGAGSLLRYLAQSWVGKWYQSQFPWGTFLINISGCLLIGFLLGIIDRQTTPATEWKLLLVTGVCGGYTTFSTFSNEGLTLFKQGYYTYFFTYILGSVILGLLATFAGWAMTK
jgi:CrcB protein